MKIWGIISIFTSVLFLAAPTFAQTAKPAPVEIMLTWSATQSLVPPEYPGRILPSPTGTTLIAAQLLENQKLVLDPTITYQWYVHNTLTASGPGVTSLALHSEEYPGNIQIRVRIFNYKEYAPIEASLYIPQGRPSVVITTPFPNNVVRLSGTLLEAFPYFFPAKNLEEVAFTWQVGEYTQATPRNTLLLTGTGPAKASFLLIKATASSREGFAQQAVGTLQAIATP